MNINYGLKINDQANKLTDSFSIDASTETKANKGAFENFLKDSLNKVNNLQIESDIQTELLATGQAENIHDVTIASAKAKISLDLTMAVRNKVVEAYKEVMRMQV